MANNDRKYVIKVTKPGQDYETELLENGAPKTGELEFYKNNNGLKKTDHYKLEFTIDDRTVADGDKVMFAPSNDHVLAVHTDLTQCPPVGSQMPYTLWVDKNQRDRLRLINMDLKPEKLRFKINMVKVSDPTSQTFIPLDPIINNGNRGGEEPFVSFAYAPLLTGAIVGVTAALLANSALVPTNALLFGIGGGIIGLIAGLLLDRR